MLDIFTVEVCTSMVAQLVKLIITVCVRVGNSASKVDYSSASKDGCYTLVGNSASKVDYSSASKDGCYTLNISSYYKLLTCTSPSDILGVVS